MHLIRRKRRFPQFVFVPITLIVFYFTNVNILLSQTVCRDIFLLSQKEVDDFQITYGCSIVSGFLHIEGDDITNLDGLSNLSSVDRLHIVYNNALTNIEGLKNLTEVQGELSFAFNNSLTNLDGLINLSKCNLLDIFVNPALTNLDGLINLTVATEISIQNNALLANIDGIKNLTSVIRIAISNNPLITNIDVFRNINNSWLDRLSIDHLDALLSLEPLYKFTNVRHLHIGFNPLITNLDGLRNIEKVNENISIRGNDALKNIDGLRNITFVGKNLSIINNRKLVLFCGLYPLFSSDGLRGDFICYNNRINPSFEKIIKDGPCITTPKNIDYKIILPDCDDPQKSLVIFEGRFKEGEKCIFYPYKLPDQYSAFQPFYDAIVNTEFFIPVGALNEDISFIINLTAACRDNFLDDPKTKDIFELFFLNIQIVGETSGAHNFLEYYYFNEGMEALIKIPLVNIDPLLDILGYDIDLLEPFFLANNLNPDFNGIRKVVDDTHYTIYSEHFSELRLGIVESPSFFEDIEKLQTEYNLSQNYPNPFNPNTIIKYSIPKQSSVSLKVFDVIGSEVAMLVNKIQQKGIYRIEFNGSELTSGIYYYRLKASDPSAGLFRQQRGSGQGFVETKKMILLK